MTLWWVVTIGFIIILGIIGMIFIYFFRSGLKNEEIVEPTFHADEETTEGEKDVDVKLP
ncbi:hypothetical protein [Peribacillus huizhouensis]|uniref:YtzI protein n=1 Tax=Peribacillus huizhouensis TaxID=1501239 RepID=A0ABR6CND8_9BACI|nr:hypothetical protein [Peribacillus huizhouensis]MBA9026495.1 hypothetical protein [Peribacillus huizhouensis]